MRGERPKKKQQQQKKDKRKKKKKKKESGFATGCSVGCGCGSVVWLTAAALIRPLAWELPYAMGMSLKRK